MAKYSVPHVRGSHKKSTTNYTHALIGRYNWDKAIAAAEVVTDDDYLDYDWYEQLSKAKVGDVLYKTDNTTLVIDSQSEIDFGIENLYKCGSRYEWGKHMANMRVTDIIFDMECTGEHSLQVLRWSSREELAKEAEKQFAEHYTDLKVVEVKLITTW